MTYKEILQKVSNNLNIDNPEVSFYSIGLTDIRLILNEVIRNTNFLTKVYENTTLDSATTSLNLSTINDFLYPLEVLFLSPEGARYITQEIFHETFLKWEPNVVLSGSFSDLVTQATPLTEHYTFENFKLDGSVGFTFADTYPRQLLWKPGVNGTLKILYVAKPAIPTPTGTPELNSLFDDLLIHGVTARMLLRQLKEAKSEIEVVAIRTLYGEYQSLYKDAVGNLIEFTNKFSNDEAKVAEPFFFLTDPDMLL
ncbi:hypothetical protein [Ignavibacterium sp.]|uniref:hypothetical protein n=1 Tax=Ignavibacterium sp. TaxID=2651167 RepID=UPI00307EBD31